jgi:hypothetical protein
MSKTEAALVQRLQDEADLCRNEGADDIARLLDEAVAALAQAEAGPVGMLNGLTEAETLATASVSGLSEHPRPLAAAAEPVAWFRAPYGTLEPNPLFRVTGPQSLDWAVACYTENQLRAAVAAERERCASIVQAVQGWEGVRDVAARIRGA